MSGALRSRVFRFIFFTTLIATTVFMAGCRTAPLPNLGHGPLTPQEVSDIVAGKKTVVLFRLTTIAGETQESLDYQQKVRWKIWRVGDWQRFRGLADGTA